MSERRTIEIRASRVPLITRCGEAAILTGDPVLIDSGGEFAKLGQAAHKLVESIDEGDWSPTVEEIASAYRVDPDDLAMLGLMARKQYKHLRVWFEGGRVEVRRETSATIRLNGELVDLHLTGTDDREGLRGNRAYGLDWKFGFLEENYKPQIQAYGYLLMQAYPGVDQIWAGICFARLQHVQAEIFTREALMLWWERFLHDLSQSAGRFNPGVHCRFCPRRMDCEAKTRYVQTALVEINSEVVVDLDNMPPEIAGPKLADIWDRIKLVTSVCETANKVIRAYVQRQEGRYLPAGNRAMVLEPTSRRKIDAQKAWPIIAQHLTQDELASCITVAKGALEKSLGAKAEKGEKGKFIKGILDELDAAGAMSEQVSYTMRLQQVVE